MASEETLKSRSRMTRPGLTDCSLRCGSKCERSSSTPSQGRDSNQRPPRIPNEGAVSKLTSGLDVVPSGVSWVNVAFWVKAAPA
jgi:hypothetical protein